MKSSLFCPILFLLVLSIAACSPPAGYRHEVFWMGRGTPAEMELWERVRKEFESEHKNIKVRLEQVPYQQYESKLQTMLAAGTAPDVVFIGPPKFNELVRLGAVQPLDEMIRSDPSFDRELYYPFVLNTYIVDGVLYGLPNDAAIVAIFYNKDLFDRQGLPYPQKGWTWDDFLLTAKALTRMDSEEGRVFGCIFGSHELWMWQNGGDYFDDNTNPKKSEFNSQANRQTFQFLHDLIYRYNVAPVPGDESVGNWFDAFKSGKIAMYITGHWEFPQLRQMKGLRWDVVELPRAKKRSNWAGGSCFCIPSLSRNKQEAYLLIKYLTGEKAQKILMDGGFSTPAIQTPEFTRQFLSAPENNAAFLDSMDSLRQNISSSGGTELISRIQERIDLYWQNKIPLEKMIIDIDRLLKDYIAQNK